jgi:ParB-like chromosome segregation protein Spo0J
VNIRNRVKELRYVPASQLQPNPKNWRTHPEAQANALRGILAEVGIAGAVLARETPEGGLMLIDGHLRAETLQNTEVPVLVLDVDEAEADKLLASIDPLGAMAEADADKLRELLEEVETASEDLANMFTDLAEGAGILDSPKDVGDSEEPEDIDEPATSGVRMVQLFLDDTNIGEFHEACSALAEAYGTENLTDTVLEAMRRASASLRDED